MSHNDYGSVNMKTGEIKVSYSKNRSGMEYLDTTIHESNHFNNPKMSERGIITKTKKDKDSYLSII